KRVTITEKDVNEEIAKARKDWKEKHKDAKPDTGPYQWHSTVTVRRDGAQTPETLLVKFADGTSETVLWDDGARWQRFTWDKPSKAISAELDPQQEVLLDDDKLNDSYSVKPDNAAARRWTSDAAALLENIYAIMVTL
ncbi:MAG: M1 family metallopeptidase, partial [Gammaproteobacteria bacterium]